MTDEGTHPLAGSAWRLHRESYQPEKWKNLFFFCGILGKIFPCVRFHWPLSVEYSKKILTWEAPLLVPYCRPIMLWPAFSTWSIIWLGTQKFDYGRLKMIGFRSSHQHPHIHTTNITINTNTKIGNIRMNFNLFIELAFVLSGLLHSKYWAIPTILLSLKETFQMKEEETYL